jgi:hypothetical protein
LHVEQHHVGDTRVTQTFQSLMPAAGNLDPVRVEFQQGAQVASDFRGIVYD